MTTDNKAKILLIDDNDDILDLLEIILYKKYEIITAQNGFEGLDKAQEVMPDCIITDIMMPVMDGIKFFNNLRKIEAVTHIPVVAVTSFVKKMNVQSLLNIGFSQVITKPLQDIFKLDDLKKDLAEKAEYHKEKRKNK